MLVLEDIAWQIERFLMIQISTSALVALVTWGALGSLGLQQAALWGLAAGIFNSIPYYGPLVVTAGLATVGFLQFGTIGMTAAVAGVAMLITTLEGSLLTPWLIGRAASMNHVAVFAGLLFWSWVWGIWHAARGAADDGRQSHLRSRRVAAACRPSARRVAAPGTGTVAA